MAETSGGGEDTPVMTKPDCREMAQLIVRLFFHDLKASQHKSVEVHLSRCPECMGRYVSLDAAYSARLQHRC